MAPLLGYWNMRGFAQPIRLMLAYTETPFEEKHYAYGPPPDYDFREWIKEKNNLGLHFPNLPYYFDDGVKISQTLAIMRYLARKYKLEAETEEDKIRSDMIEQQIYDMRNNITSLWYNKEYEKLKGNFLENLPSALKAVSGFLGKRQWFASENKLTYVDFLVYEVLDHHRHMAPDCLNDYQNLKEFMDRFQELPTIRKYMQSPKFIKYPLMGDRAQFGSRFSKK